MSERERFDATAALLFAVNVALAVTQVSHFWWLHAGLAAFMLYLRLGGRAR